MDKKICIIILVLLSVPGLTACNTGHPRVTETSRVIAATATATEQKWVFPTATLRRIAPIIPTPPAEVDPEYYDGIIAITQYYTFLGHSLYEEAYQLLSLSARKWMPSVEDYVTMAKVNFKTVKIIMIQPLYINSMNQGGRFRPDPKGQRRFFVQIIAWGEGNMSGSRMSGELQDLFITLVKEEEGWKIDYFATSPPP